MLKLFPSGLIGIAHFCLLKYSFFFSSSVSINLVIDELMNLKIIPIQKISGGFKQKAINFLGEYLHTNEIRKEIIIMLKSYNIRRFRGLG